MAERWRIVPTTRRTSKPDRVDIIAEDGRFVAGYVKRSDALRMVPDPATVAEEAIGLFLEFRERYDDYDAALAATLLEITDGYAIDVDAIEREMQAESERRVPVTAGGPLPDLEDLPF